MLNSGAVSKCRYLTTFFKVNILGYIGKSDNIEDPLRKVVIKS